MGSSRGSRTRTPSSKTSTKLRAIGLITVVATTLFLLVFVVAAPVLLTAAFPGTDKLTGVNWARAFAPSVQVAGVIAAAATVLMGAGTAARLVVQDWLQTRLNRQ